MREFDMDGVTIRFTREADGRVTINIDDRDCGKLDPNDLLDLATITQLGLRDAVRLEA